MAEVIRELTLIIPQNREVWRRWLGHQPQEPSLLPSPKYQPFLLRFIVSWLQVGCYSFTIIPSYCQVQRPAAVGLEWLKKLSLCESRHMYSDVHCSTIFNSQNMETT